MRRRMVPTVAALEPRRLCNVGDDPISAAIVPIQVYVPVGTGGFTILISLKPVYPPATDPTYTPPPSSVAG
jgi:hypothetical protein